VGDRTARPNLVSQPSMPMPRLTHRDLRAALRFLAACDAGSGLEAFAASVTTALPALIRSEITVFGTLDARKQTLRAVENPRVTSAADLDTYVRLSRETSNPLLAHFAATGDPEARRMTDFLSRRQFHHLPLYADFYRQFRIESVLGIVIGDRPGAFDGITVNRGRREFDERERGLLTLIRPHLVEAARTARAIDRLRADLGLALRALESPGFALIVLAEGGRVRFMSPHAAGWLRTYFGPRRRADRLPESLDRWVRRYEDSARGSSQLPPLRTPFAVARDGSRLLVRLVTGAPDTVLLLEEQAPRCDPARLASLGLSSREVEVLGWVAEGKTSPEIAMILGLSRRTVQTYLERVFGKLGVDRRAAAVARVFGADDRTPVAPGSAVEAPRLSFSRSRARPPSRQTAVRRTSRQSA
jgi:DNA-binding CsgD family transcriptional regulator